MKTLSPSLAILIGMLAVGMTVSCSPSSHGRSPAGPDVASPSGLRPQVTSIEPTVGSTEGDTTLTITGIDFQQFVSVTFDGVQVLGRSDSRYASTKAYVQTPPHAAGVVDIVVTNGTGLSQRLPGAYTYTSPATFDFNGVWAASSYDGSDRTLAFTIQDDLLLSVTCFGATGDTASMTFATPPAVRNGAFSISQDDFSMTGRMVAPAAAVGTINVAPCTNMKWDTYPKKD